MGSHLLLDTSALLTLRHDEPGAGRVEEALEQPGRGYACFLSRMEVPLLEQVASIKVHHALSLADAWIAAADQHVAATLPQEWLS